jgi:hypothetical protein
VIKNENIDMNNNNIEREISGAESFLTSVKPSIQGMYYNNKYQ